MPPRPAERHGVNVILELGGYSQGIDLNPAALDLNDEQADLAKKRLAFVSPKKANSGLMFGAGASYSRTSRKKRYSDFISTGIARDTRNDPAGVQWPCCSGTIFSMSR